MDHKKQERLAKELRKNLLKRKEQKNKREEEAAKELEKKETE